MIDLQCMLPKEVKSEKEDSHITSCLLCSVRTLYFVVFRSILAVFLHYISQHNFCSFNIKRLLLNGTVVAILRRMYLRGRGDGLTRKEKEGKKEMKGMFAKR